MGGDTKIWYNFSLVSLWLTTLFPGDLVGKYTTKLPNSSPVGKFISCAVAFCTIAFYIGRYAAFLSYLLCSRRPVPYKLRRSEKRLFDCAFLVVCSCWYYYQRDVFQRLTLVLILCSHVIPTLNLWWGFDNSGFWNYFLVILIEAAVIRCRHSAVLLMTVAVLGLARQLAKKKNII